LNVAIIGLGNILLMDEGVGVHAIEALRKDYDFPENIRLIDGGTMGLDLLHFIEGVDRMLIIDAVDFKKEPGTIAVIEDDDIPSFISTKLSVHQIGLPDVLFALKLMDTKPPKMTLIGIQPEKMEMGLALSESVGRNFNLLLKTIIEKLYDWRVECVSRGSF